MKRIRPISVGQSRETETVYLKAGELDGRFDDGEDLADLVDWSGARRPNPETHRVNIDFPAWVVQGWIRKPCVSV